MLQGGNPLTVGVGIIIEVIRKNNSDYDPPGINAPGTIPTTYDPIYLGTLLRIFGQHIPDFMALLNSSKHTVNEGGQVKRVERVDLTSPWGAKVEPLGFDRFKTCELMAELLHCSNMGLLNQPGSEHYIRERDTERERLVREGTFNINGEGFSSVDFNDSSDFVNGSSVLGSGSPEDVKTLEVTNAGEEEGFEDVSASSVLVNKEQDAASSQDTKNEQAASEPAGPMSPTASSLTEQMGDIKLEGEQGSKEATPEDRTSEKPETQKPKEQEPASAPMSSNLDVVPAPLFASKQQEGPPTAGETESSAEKGQGQKDEKVPELKLHPFAQADINGQPVVGDYLKIMFVEHKVVPTILVCLHALVL